jgi:hypothetical protein
VAGATGADRTWRVTVDGTQYEVRVTYSLLTSGATVHRDGEVVARGHVLVAARRFEIGLGHRRAVVEVDFPDADDVRSRLFLDGHEVDPRPA